MLAPSAIKVGRTSTGFRVRVEGKGTLRESPAVQEFAGQAFRDEACTVVVDLSACDYLDSTFLGCLVTLHKRYGCGQTPRLLIAASPAVRQRVLAPNHLDSLFRIIGECPEVFSEDTVSPVALGSRELGWHIMECHRRLAEAGGPNREAFGQVAEGLARELVETRGDDD
jgi:anti-anti-sigma factor